MSTHARTITVRYEGIDHHGKGFAFERRIDATYDGGNPRLHGERIEEDITRAGNGLRDDVERMYAVTPDTQPEEPK